MNSYTFYFKTGEFQLLHADKLSDVIPITFLYEDKATKAKISLYDYVNKTKTHRFKLNKITKKSTANKTINDFLIKGITKELHKHKPTFTTKIFNLENLRDLALMLTNHPPLSWFFYVVPFGNKLAVFLTSSISGFELFMTTNLTGSVVLKHDDTLVYCLCDELDL